MTSAEKLEAALKLYVARTSNISASKAWVDEDITASCGCCSQIESAYDLWYEFTDRSGKVRRDWITFDDLSDLLEAVAGNVE